MKKITVFCIAITGLAFFLATPGRAAEGDSKKSYREYPPEMQRILDRKKIIVAMYHRDIPPFMMHDKDGNFIGHDVELAKDIARKLGVECEFNRKPKTFNAIIETVVRHEADIAISLISATLRRAKKVRFTQPYLILHPTLIINRLTASQYSFTGKDPLKEIRATDKKIGEKKGTSYVGIAGNIFKNAKIVEYEDWGPTMEAVHKGEVFAALRDEIGVNNLILQNPDLAIKLQMIVLKDMKDPLAIAVPSDSPHLLDWLNLYLNKYHPEITADDLLNKYADYYQENR